MRRALSELLFAVRRAGVRVSTAEAIDAGRALEHIGIARRDDLVGALRATLAKSADDGARVERLVDAFLRAEGRREADLYERLRALGFGANELDALRELLVASARRDGGLGLVTALAQGPSALLRLLELSAERAHVPREPDAARVGYFTARVLETARMPRALHELAALRSRLADALGPRGVALADALEAELRSVHKSARASVVARMQSAPARGGLAHTPFAELDPSEVHAVERAVRELAARLLGRALVRARHARRGRLDLSRTMRASLATAGIPFKPVYRGRAPRKPKLVLLCDVSDSVRASARFMLLFVHAVQRLFDDARSFVFVSELREATAVFRSEPAARAVELAYGGSLVRVADNSDYARVWRTMLAEHADALGSRTTLLVLGDGRSNHFEAGETVFAELARRAGRVLWLTPERESEWASDGCALARYAPSVDEILPVYDLDTLQRAARALSRF